MIRTERESWWTAAGNTSFPLWMREFTVLALMFVKVSCMNHAVFDLRSDAYAIGKKEKPPFSPQNNPSSSSSSDPVPAVLLCLICTDLLTDAVMIPCCRSSYCDECECLIKQTSVRSKQAVSDNLLVSGIRTCLLESDEHVCPTCRQSDVSPDSLTANTVLRQVRPQTLFLLVLHLLHLQNCFMILSHTGGESF